LSAGPKARLARAGSGADEAELRRLTYRHGVSERVTFLGQFAEVPALMAAADAVLVPSEHEAFSLSAAEALQGGTPVIAQCTGGVPEVVGGDGVLVDERTPAAWARAIDAVLADLPAARARAQRARERLLTDYAPDRVLAAIRGVYAQLM
jgi:glycosyltransferase involved in cell wall biosynthesis